MASKSIFYWCPALEKPTGGVRVVYQHCEILNKLYGNARVFHWENTGFRCNWFNHDNVLKRDWVFNNSTDFSIIPDMYASRLGGYLGENNLKYGIFVQNQSFTLFDSVYTTPAYSKSAYLNADMVITISEQTTRFVKYLFPEIADEKLVQLRPSITGCFVGEKEKLITCMPRKLPFHGQVIEQMLQQKLPKDWKFVHLDGMSQSQVYEQLSKSSIFISLSDIEGLGLPPIEAALSSNLVVGYTGVGGNEYFEVPLFQAIPYGDFELLIESVLNAIRKVDSGFLFSREVLESISRLQEYYSVEEEMYQLRRMKELIDKI